MDEWHLILVNKSKHLKTKSRKMINEKKDELQSKALKTFIEAGSKGTIVLETGSGKSKVALDFVKQLPNETAATILITSPRTNLKQNWHDELIKWGFQEWREGWWTYNGKRYMVVMENIQTAYKWKDRKFTTIIMDEIHTMMTPEYSKLLENNEYNSLMGLTATHDMTDENDKELYYKQFCPVIFEYYNSAEDGLINKTRFFIVNHTLSNDDEVVITRKVKGKEVKEVMGELAYYEYMTERMKYGQQRMMQEGSQDWFADAREWFWQRKGTPAQKGAAAIYLNAIKARKTFLLNVPSTARIAAKISDGIRKAVPESKVLVFSELTAQADKISAATVHSHHSNKVNAQHIADFNSGDLRQLGSCNSLTLGLNLIGATHAVLESYIGSATQSKQKKGRLDRLASDEHADFWILRVPNTQSDTWYKKMTKKFDLSEAMYLSSDFILRDDFDYEKSEIKTKVATITNP